MVTVDCKYRCDDGKAPSEQLIETMYYQIQEYAKARKYGLPITERQYWVEGPVVVKDELGILTDGGVMFFMIFMDFESA